MSKSSKAKSKGRNAKLKGARAKAHAKNFSKINDPRRYVPHSGRKIRSYPRKKSKIA